MGVTITGVQRHTAAARAGILAGDILLSINGNEISDVLDYMFYAAENLLELSLQRLGEPYSLLVHKGEYDDLGLEFSTFLMDEKRACHNKCVFCFIDQMPPNMRETLYFKDDDARLSFLQGNYVTLTNLDQKDIDRIIKMKLNINVSVHTTNPELRAKMMNNRFAGERLDYLYQMAAAGIRMNCQIVLCPELNDGAELERTLTDLGKLMPNIQSVAVVPVGLTKFREGLYPLRTFTLEEANKSLEIIEKFQKDFLAEYGTRVVFPSDEFYLLAKKPLPKGEEYEDYPQYENGVGMLRSLSDEFESALEEGDSSVRSRKISVATGVLATEPLKNLIEKAKKKWHNFECELYTIQNHYFGESITVAGLITGQDLTEQLMGKDLGEELLIPAAMLKKDEPIFLDDMTLQEAERLLSVKITPTENDGYDLLEKMLGTKL